MSSADSHLHGSWGWAWLEVFMPASSQTGNEHRSRSQVALLWFQLCPFVKFFSLSWIASSSINK